jgi:hypothetical protein
LHARQPFSALFTITFLYFFITLQALAKFLDLEPDEAFEFCIEKKTNKKNFFVFVAVPTKV